MTDSSGEGEGGTTIQVKEYDLPSNARVFCIQTILRDTLDKLDVVANIHAPVDDAADMSAVQSALSERQAMEADLLALLHEREHTTSIRAKKANHEALRTLLGTFRGAAKTLGVQLSTENASIAVGIAGKLRKEKLRLLAILLRTARELKSTSACPTLFKTVQVCHRL